MTPTFTRPKGPVRFVDWSWAVRTATAYARAFGVRCEVRHEPYGRLRWAVRLLDQPVPVREVP